MPDAFDDLWASYEARPPRRRLRLPPGWRDPDEEPELDLDTFRRGEPSVMDSLRGGLFDPDLNEIEFQHRLDDYSATPEPSTSRRYIDKAVRHIFEPPEFIREGADTLANWLDTPTLEADLSRPVRAFAGGAVKGAAELLNPFDLATSTTALSSVRNARRLSNSLEALQAGGSAFLTGAGLERGRRAFVEDRPEDYGQAAFETAMGAAGIAGGMAGMRGPDPALRGQLLHPEGWSPTGSAIGPRRRPPQGRTFDADFWSPDDPFGPQGPSGGVGGYLDDPSVQTGEILPDEGRDLPYRRPAGYLPEPRPQIDAARRYGTGPDDLSDPTLDELDAFMRGLEPPRTDFYQGRAGVVRNDPDARLDDITDLAELVTPARQQPNIRPVEEPRGGVLEDPQAVTPEQRTPATAIEPPAGDEFDPLVRARRGGRVDVSGLDPRVLREVGRIVSEMEQFKYEPGSFAAEDPLARAGDPTQNRQGQKGNYTDASPQAQIVHALQQLTGLSTKGGDMARRLRQVIETGRGDSLWDAAVQLAQARVGGQRRFKDPTGMLLQNPYTGEPIDLRALLGPEAGDWAVPESQRAAFGEQELGDNEVSFQEVEAVADRLDPEFVDRWSRGFVSDREMRAAIDEANAADVSAFFDDVREPRSEVDELDAILSEHGEGLPEPTLVDESDLNASGESAASLEALSRQQGMQARGEEFVVYDRAGNKRVLIGPEAVDYQVRPGELYGIETREGFQVLDDAGGNLPRGVRVQDIKEALSGPKDRIAGMHPNELEAMELVDEILGDYEPQPGGYNQGFGELPAEGPRGNRMRRLEDLLPEGYLDDPAAQDWLRRLREGEVTERRGDVLDTGELQPRLAGAEGVRDLDVATPEIADAPYSLMPEAFEDPGVQPRLEDIVDVEGERWPETRHEVENPAKVDEIAQSMQRVGWKGRPALVLNLPDGSSIAWTATHRLAAARQAGIPYADIPKLEIDAAELAAKGFDPIALTKEGKKTRIKALVDSGLTDAANLLEAERQGSPERTAAAASGVPEEVPQNVADFLYKQLKYSRAEIAAMGPAEAVRVGKERIVNPNAPAPRPAEAPEVGLERLLESDPELAAAYERNVSGIVERQATRNLEQLRRRVPRRDVYTGGADAEANLPASQLGLPQRSAPPAGVEAEDLITEGLRERPRRERPESELTSQEREARGLAPLAKPGKPVTQSEARGKQTEMVHRAREMARLINNPSPQNLDEYVRLLGEQHKSQTKRELTGGTTTEGPKRYRETGEYLASGLGGLERLYRENPAAFWTLMRSGGGALFGALVDDEDPLRGAALGAIVAGGAPFAFNRVRQILRTGKLKPPKASEKDISWYRLFMAPSPERTIPDVFKRAQESMRDLERLYADPTRSQSSNIAAKQLYLGDLARELRELAVEAKDAGLKRKSWYLNAMANAVGGVPTMGQRKVTEIGSRLLESFGFSSRKDATPLHQSITDAFAGGRTKLQEAADNLARVKREHSARAQARDPRTPPREMERSRVDVDAARDRLQQAMRDVGQSLRDAASTIDAEVGRTSNPGLVNQARRSREVGRKVQHYKSVKQALAALERLEGELGQGELRVRPDVVESTVSKVVYRTLIGYALDTAIQNLSQPVLATLFVKPSSLVRGYRYARTPKGRALAHEIELRSLVDEETGAVDDRPLRVVADADGTLKAVKTAIKDSSRPLRVTDNYNRRVSYLAALDQKGVLEEALRTGRVPEDADEFAREVVRKTQGHVGPLGNNPFQRGPIAGSFKPFTKYPGLFLENVIDAMNDPQARGRAAVVALLGAMLAARGTGLDFEDMLIAGGRPFGINLAQPGSLRPDRVARATPAGRALADVVGHVSDVAGGERMTHDVVGHDLDSFLHGDLAYLLFGRYPSKLAQKGVEVGREGFGQHQGLTPTGEADPHPASEDLAELVGVRSTRITEKRARDREAQEAVNRSRRSREDTGAEARRLATIAMQRGDDEGLQEALAMMTPAQRRAFLRQLGRTRRERLEQQLPRAERPGFREEFIDEDELADFVEGR